MKATRDREFRKVVSRTALVAQLALLTSGAAVALYRPGIGAFMLFTWCVMALRRLEGT